jgi:hypothetical protein
MSEYEIMKRQRDEACVALDVLAEHIDCDNCPLGRKPCSGEGANHKLNCNKLFKAYALEEARRRMG